MSTKHLVVGAGPVGTAIATQLAEAGHEVHLASRSGSGPAVPGATRVAVDAADAPALTRLATGAATVYNAVNPVDYHKWPTIWPPIAAALLTTAERSGAVLATVSNLYPYGRVDGPMSENTPLVPADIKGEVRKQMWLDTLAAHEAGRIRVVEVRGSDYVGARAISHLSRAATALVTGKRAQLIGKADLAHSWTYTGDVARLIIAAAADESAHGRAWHVPSSEPRSQRQALTDMAEISGLPMVGISEAPTAILRLIGLFNPPMRAVADSSYQFKSPFVIDDSAARAQFDQTPTAWRDVLAETVAYARATATTTASATAR